MIRQRTIKGQVEIKGIGLQTGKEVILTLKTSPANSGINFIRADLPNKPFLNIRSIFNPDSNQGPERRTTLGVGPLQVQTTEHFLAALSGMGIDNIVAQIDNVELPGLDGSAKGFVDLLKETGILEQDAPKKILELARPVWCEKGESLITIFPSERFQISYTLSYKNPSLGTQFLDIVLDEGNFETEIAPARTFCLEDEALELLKRGLGKGADYENTLVIGKTGPIKNKFRFPDEPVRHKILDLIGDLYLIGMPIKGHVVALKSGHSLNMELARKLREEVGNGKRGN
ncbi:MAG: UDP-3-O-[3-hydroxymyristoyl] N-acetylglucosamine deacetylase [Omnitrophica bacterium RIFCSPLOWO2_01_FULL_45_10]|nr:MAG: UDP-3-O-[3-hydroxymyristoyl] N-acetylglucosamine deacetylase [Omnitrophica bacterium RIFCSPLOWO2_01_FULL_45_10]